jgi:hypothetical protein
MLDLWEAFHEFRPRWALSNEQLVFAKTHCVKCINKEAYYEGVVCNAQIWLSNNVTSFWGDHDSLSHFSL